jgi:hypothetical protein
LSDEFMEHKHSRLPAWAEPLPNSKRAENAFKAVEAMRICGDADER